MKTQLPKRATKQKTVTDEKTVVLLYEGGEETSWVRPELKVLTFFPPSFIPHEGKREGTVWADICTTSVHFDGLVANGKGLRC